MRAVIQRVLEAAVIVNEQLAGRIANGLLVFAGIEDPDNLEDAKWLSSKIVNMRIFNDDQGVMNLSILQTGGDILLVSQFTLHASVKKGNRPSYIRASKPETAIPLYNELINQLQANLSKPFKQAFLVPI